MAAPANSRRTKAVYFRLSLRDSPNKATVCSKKVQQKSREAEQQRRWSFSGAADN